MYQLIQNLKNGQTLLEEVPCPIPQNGQVLIKTTHSLVSLGTERMLVEFGKANLISKARQQPEKVKQVLDKIKTEGVMPTLEAVFNKLDQPLPLGYCNVGEVVAVGDGILDFKIGDRVASNGNHAEYVCVPQNLVAHIPDNVTNEQAAFTVIGSIGLQGIRLIQPALGETVVVMGMGLIGLLTAQLLTAHGCKVIGIDLDPQKLALAQQWGLETFQPQQGDVVKFIEEQTHGVGADAVIITASAKSNDIVSQSARMSRKRGRIILVGVVGLELNRSEFYEKELTFQVSCSYGPGRYDDNYEQKGQDYPLAFVRWTEKRNFEAVLQAISSGAVRVDDMISEVVNLDQYHQIYDNIGSKNSIASILKYPQESERKTSVKYETKKNPKGTVVLGIIGAGNFTKMTVLPILKKLGVRIKYIASQGGLSGTSLAKKYGIENSTTNYKDILEDDEVTAVMVMTRHNTHSNLVCEVLEADKHVFVEKPLAINSDQLEEVCFAYEKSAKTITVGFNRRFSPHIQAIRKELGNAPMSIVATMNAGHIPPEVWVHDMSVGGGRIIGEAVHYFDLCQFIADSPIEQVNRIDLGVHPKENSDTASFLLKMSNGTTAVVNYFANGSKSYSKEKLEIYSQERTITMDNFRETRGYGTRNFKRLKTRINKGHETQFQEWLKALEEGNEFMSFDELLNVSSKVFS